MESAESWAGYFGGARRSWIQGLRYRALLDYAALRQVGGPRNRRAFEEAVSLDQALGPGFADCIRRLRLLRNQVAHEPIYHHSSEDAAGYARHAFTLIGALGRRISCLETLAPS